MFIKLNKLNFILCLYALQGMMECNFCKCDIGPNMFASVGKIQIMEFYVDMKYPKCDKEAKRNHGIVTACGGCLIKIYQFFNLLCGVKHGDYTEFNWKCEK